MLKSPPAQTTQEGLSYHEDPQVDTQIRAVKHLRDQEYDLATIQEMVGLSRQGVLNYLRKIHLAQKAYIDAFPAEFSSGVEALKAAISKRRTFDKVLREELQSNTASADDSYRQSLLRLILENRRGLKKLLRFHIARLMHQGEVPIRSNIEALLDRAPGHDEVVSFS